VLLNQLSLFVVLAFAFGVGGDGPVSAYTYGWSFMQMPYAVVVVSVLVSSRRNSLACRPPPTSKVERATAIRTSTVARHHHPVHARAPGARAAIVSILVKHFNASHRWDVGTVLAVLAPDCPASRSFNFVCAACSRCNVRARSSISTRFKMC